MSKAKLIKKDVDVIITPVIKPSDLLKDYDNFPRILADTYGYFRIEIKGNLEYKTILKLLSIIEKNMKNKRTKNKEEIIIKGELARKITEFEKAHPEMDAGWFNDLLEEVYYAGLKKNNEKE